MVATSAPVTDSNAQAWATFAESAKPALTRFERSLERPASAQAGVFDEVIAYGTNTAFGHYHGFAEIRTLQQFRERVPISRWGEYAHWIERTEHEAAAVLTAQTPLHFERTSGSSAQVKHIPYTRALLSQFQRGLTVWLAELYAQCPTVAGPAWWSVSPLQALGERTANGIPIGSASDAVYLQGCAAEALLATVIDTAPAAAGAHWKARTLAMVAEREDLALISVWSPTFLGALLATVTDAASRQAGVDRIEPLLRPARFRALVDAIDAQNFSRLWPNLKVISAWADGPSEQYAARIAQLFPQATLVPKGLFATEGIVSLSWGTTRHRPLAIESHFLEFLDDAGRARLVEELESGQRYEPVLTTAGGLYRYALGDVVEVTGFLGRTPTVRFLGRADLRCDLVGEKLDANQVAAAFAAATLTAPAVLVPALDSQPPQYILIMQTGSADDKAARRLDAALRGSFHYDIARRNGQLAPVFSVQTHDLAALLHDAWEALAKRSGDVKSSYLISAPELARQLLAACRAAGSLP